MLVSYGVHQSEKKKQNKCCLATLNKYIVTRIIATVMENFIV